MSFSKSLMVHDGSWSASYHDHIPESWKEKGKRGTKGFPSCLPAFQDASQDASQHIFPQPCQRPLDNPRFPGDAWPRWAHLNKLP